MMEFVNLKTEEEQRRDIEKQIVECLQMERKIHEEAIDKIRALMKRREALYRQWKKLGGKVE